MQTLKLTKKYETYPEYKDSGVEWLGKTPKEWELSKARKFISQIEPGIWGDDPKQDNNDIKCLRVADFNFDKLTFNNVETVRNNPGIPSRKILRNGDILIEKSGGGEKQPVGRAVIFNSDEVMTCANFVDIVRLKKEILPRFFTYQLYAAYASKLNLKSIKQNTGIQNLDIFLYFSEIYLIPPHSQQTNIVKYLDEEIFRIDQITERKQKLIEILREKRTAVINHAVTKGLDSKVEFIESGVEWIGKMPKGWSASSLKTLLKMKITDGPHTTPMLLEDGIRFISAESIQANNTIDFNKNRGFISYNDHVEFCRKANPQRDDIFMVKSGATTGRVAIVETDSEFSIWSPLALIRTNINKALPKYIYFFLQSGLFQDQVKFSWSFGTQQNIGMRVIENLMIVYPSLKEQKEVVEYLEYKIPNLEIAIQKVEKSIETLQEFKSSLISNVVTGKIKV